MTPVIALALLTAAPVQAERLFERFAASPAPADAQIDQADAAPLAPPPDVQTAGSLWQDSSGRQMLGLDGNARRVGDLVTVLVHEQSTSDLGASTSSNKNNSRSGQVGGLFGLETGILSANSNMNGSIGFEVGSDATFEGGGATSANVAVSATVTCEVIEVLPSGALRVKGHKEVRNYRETQFVTVMGVVRPQDIRMDNTVSSQHLAGATIEIHGQGSISERTRPGVGTRVLDVAWPF